MYQFTLVYKGDITMIVKETLIKETLALVDILGVDVNKLGVITSGSLLYRGIVESSNDIDVTILAESENEVDSILGKIQDLKGETKYIGDMIISTFENYDILITTNKDRFDREFETVKEGFRIETLKCLVDRKLSWNREKDREHLKLIFNHLYENQK